MTLTEKLLIGAGICLLIALGVGVALAPDDGKRHCWASATAIGISSDGQPVVSFVTVEVPCPVVGPDGGP